MYPVKMIISLLLALIFVAACGPESTEPGVKSVNPESTEAVDFLTETPPAESVSPLPSIVVETESIASIPAATLEPEQPIQTELLQSSEPPDSPGRITKTYRVAFVEQNDVLNVRAGPGVEFDIQGELAPGTARLNQIDSARSSIDGLWFRISDGQTDGWVNSRYLVEVTDPGIFCDSPRVEALLEEFILTMSSGDGQRLSDLVAESRGIRFRRHWWNPEVYYQHDEVSGIFEDERSLLWGIADGSGEAIEGTFSNTIGPLITSNLLKWTENDCNNIVHGGTAGLVVLPESYEGVNYFSLYRAPGKDAFELDWGTWVVGIESWEGEYYLSFMVHYEWEI